MKREKCPKDKKGAAPPRRSNILPGKDLKMTGSAVVVNRLGIAGTGCFYGENRLVTCPMRFPELRRITPFPSRCGGRARAPVCAFETTIRAGYGKQGEKKQQLRHRNAAV